MELRDPGLARLRRRRAARGRRPRRSPARCSRRRPRRRTRSSRRRRPTPPRFFELTRRRGRADRRTRARRCAPSAAHGPLRAHRLHARASGAGRSATSADERRGRAGASRTTRPGAILEQWTRPPGRVAMARGYAGRLRAQAERAVRLDPAVRAVPGAVRRLPPAVPAAAPRPARAARLRRLARLLQPRRDRRVGAARLPRAALPAGAHAVDRASGRASAPSRSCRTWRSRGWRSALVFLVGFRIALNVVDSNVIDVGYAGVIGADRIADGDGALRRRLLRGRRARATPTGRSTTCPTSRSSRRLRWSGKLGRPARRPRRGDRLRPAHHGRAAPARPAAAAGPRGAALGVALAYAWAAFPYTTFALETNSNDSLVAMVRGARRARPALRRARPAARDWRVGLGAAAKFAPLALAPLFARRHPARWPRRAGRRRGARWRVAVPFAPFIPDGGLRELYDRTVGYQAGRGSPFSVWGQYGVARLAADRGEGRARSALALAVAFVPRRRDARAGGGARRRGADRAAARRAHWFYLYVVWFAPFVLVARTHATEPSTGTWACAGRPAPRPRAGPAPR